MLYFIFGGMCLLVLFETVLLIGLSSMVFTQREQVENLQTTLNLVSASLVKIEGEIKSLDSITSANYACINDLSNKLADVSKATALAMQRAENSINRTNKAVKDLAIKARVHSELIHGLGEHVTDDIKKTAQKKRTEGLLN